MVKLIVQKENNVVIPTITTTTTKNREKHTVKNTRFRSNRISVLV
jgi:hypothetical protein